MHRGYTAERYLDAPGRGPAAVPDLAVSTDIIVGFPGRDRRRLRAHARGRGRGASTTTPTRSSSRRGPAPRRRDDRPLRRPAVVPASASSGCGRRRAIGAAPPPGPDRVGSRRSWSRARARRTRRAHRAHPPEQARPLPGADGCAAPGTYATVEVTGAAPHHLPAASSSVLAEPSHRAHPGPGGSSARGAVDRGDPPVPRRPDGAGKSTWRWRRGASAGRRRDRVVDAMQVYRGMDIGTAKPTPIERRSVHHCLDLVDPTRTSRSPTTSAADGGRREHRRRGRAAARRRHRPLPPRRDRRPRPAGAVAGRPAPLEAELVTSAPARRLARARSGRRQPDRAHEPPAGRAGARGDARQRAARSARSGRASTSTPDVGVVQIGLRWPRPALAERIDRRYAAMIDAGLLDEVARWRPTARRLSGTAAQALGYKELLDHLAGRVARRGGRRPSSGAPASSPSARSAGSAATPAYAGSTSITTRSPTPRTGRRGPEPRLTSRARSPSTTASATTSSCSSTSTATPAPGPAGRVRRAVVRPPPRRGRADGCSSAGRRRRTGADWSWPLQRRRQPGRDERQRHPLLRPGRGAGGG